MTFFLGSTLNCLAPIGGILGSLDSLPVVWIQFLASNSCWYYPPLPKLSTESYYSPKIFLPSWIELFSLCLILELTTLLPSFLFSSSYSLNLSWGKTVASTGILKISNFETIYTSSFIVPSSSGLVFKLIMIFAVKPGAIFPYFSLYGPLSSCLTTILLSK